MKVRTYSSFDLMPESYLSLFERAGEQWYDYSLPWFRNFVGTALDEGDRLCIYGVELDDDCGTPVAALATRYKERSSGFFSRAHLSSLSNFYTITFSPAGDLCGETASEAYQALSRALAQDSHRWDLIELRPLDPAAPVYSHLLHSLRSAGLVVQPFFCFGNWYLTAEGLRYDEYFKTLPSAMQNTIRRKTKKLEKTGRSRIEIVTCTHNLDSAIDAYEKIYISSWKRPEPYPRFVSGLIRACAAKNWLRLGVVYLDDQPIAAQVWIVNSGRATIYKLGQDQRYDEYSAGSILTARLMQHVLDIDKVREIDFGSGDDPYKKNWLPQRRERWGILAMNPRSLFGCWEIVRNIGGRKAKTVWQSVRRRFSTTASKPAAIQEEA